MKKQLLMAAVAGFCLMTASAAIAENVAPPELAPLSTQMSPEQADKLDAFKNMTPEEKKAFKEERKQAFQSLSPEEKEELKQKFKDRRGGFHHRGAAGE